MFNTIKGDKTIGRHHCSYPEEKVNYVSDKSVKKIIEKYLRIGSEMK